MKTRVFMFQMIAALVLFLPAVAQSADTKAAQQTYEKQGRELLAAINSGKVDIQAAKKNVEGMVQSADVLFEAYVAKHPESNKLYEYMKANM